MKIPSRRLNASREARETGAKQGCPRVLEMSFTVEGGRGACRKGKSSQKNAHSQASESQLLIKLAETAMGIQPLSCFW